DRGNSWLAYWPRSFSFPRLSTMSSSIYRSTSVFFLQRALALDNPRLKADGLFGAETQSALRQFQQRRRLPDTGVVCEQTHALLAQAACDAGLLFESDVTAAADALGVTSARVLALLE